MEQVLQTSFEDLFAVGHSSVGASAEISTLGLVSAHAHYANASAFLLLVRGDRFKNIRYARNPTHVCVFSQCALVDRASRNWITHLHLQPEVGLLLEYGPDSK